MTEIWFSCEDCEFRTQQLTKAADHILETIPTNNTHRVLVTVKP